jgi:hypothetical protein
MARLSPVHRTESGTVGGKTTESKQMMDELLHVVTYTGPFGFIKPWTAVRDGETYSQQFLTPSIIEGMRQKLEVSDILRHRLSHQGFDRQQERIQSAGWGEKGAAHRRTFTRAQSILVRGIMLNPTLHLTFPSSEEAKRAAKQHLCLCRNEDIMLPSPRVQTLSVAAFDDLVGFELHFGRTQAGAFLVGYNRFDDGAPMYGALTITGDPTTAPIREV